MTSQDERGHGPSHRSRARQDADDVLARLQGRVEKDPALLDALVLLADKPVGAVRRRSSG